MVFVLWSGPCCNLGRAASMIRGCNWLRLQLCGWAGPATTKPATSGTPHTRERVAARGQPIGQPANSYRQFAIIDSY